MGDAPAKARSDQPEGTLVGSLSGAGENAVYELVSSSPF